MEERKAGGPMTIRKRMGGTRRLPAMIFFLEICFKTTSKIVRFGLRLPAGQAGISEFHSAFCIQQSAFDSFL